MRRLSPRQVFARTIIKRRQEEYRDMWIHYASFRELYEKIVHSIAEIDGKWEETEIDKLDKLRGKKEGLLELKAHIEQHVSTEIRESFQDNGVPPSDEDNTESRPETDNASSAPEADGITQRESIANPGE